jgi:hypothetical protein
MAVMLLEITKTVAMAVTAVMVLEDKLLALVQHLPSIQPQAVKAVLAELLRVMVHLVVMA